MRSVTPPPAFRGSFLTDPLARAAYSEGAGPFRVPPDAVAVPNDLADILALVRHAADHAIPLVPRGAGSGIPGGNVGHGIIVDLQRLARPVFVSAQSKANVGAAVTWQELDKAAGLLKLRLPPNPSSGAFCTIGGMVATNAAGARSVRSGSIRKWVRGVELVTVDGEAAWIGRQKQKRGRRNTGPYARRHLAQGPAALERFRYDVAPALLNNADLINRQFPKTRKNSSGYALDSYLASGDLLDLVIGSEGTLGIITRVELDLELRHSGQATVLLAVNDLNALGDLVEFLLTLNPAAVELLDRSYLALAAEPLPLPSPDVEAVLVVEFEEPDTARAERAAAEAITGSATWHVHAEAALTDEARERLWKVRHAASPTLAALPDQRRSLQIVEDGCVPIAQLGRYVAGVREAAKDVGVEIVAFGHAGDGHLHVNALVEPVPGFEDRLNTLLLAVTGLVRDLGGTVSGEHGDGRLRAGLLESMYGAQVVDLFRQVKTAFDPLGIMNPGVILPAPDAPPFGGTLKVGAEAPDIPADVATRLRDMERAAGWGTSRLDWLT